LHSLLSGFFHSGPIGKPFKFKKRGACVLKFNHAIQKLHINIESSIIIGSEALAPPELAISQAEWGEQGNGDEFIVVPPETFGRFMDDALEALLGHPLAVCSTALFERIGQIILSVEGVHKKQWILKSILDGMEDSRRHRLFKKEIHRTQV
jgi:hypothetical protein